MPPKIYDDPLFIKALKQPRYALKRGNRKILHFIDDQIRVLRQSLSSDQASTIVNQKEIQVFGLRRSGNHALIEWILAQEKQVGSVHFINDVPVGENPYRFQYEYYTDHYKDEWWYPEESARIKKAVRGDFRPLASLIFNYEDRDLTQVIDTNFEKKHDLYVGATGRRYSVIILRDPFNLFASRIKGGFPHVKSSRYNLIDYWLFYAKEFLNETNYLKYQKVAVNYNLWASVPSYRREIAQQLGLTFTDEGIQRVSGMGGGSSFDERKFDGQAQAMKTDERWRYYLEDDFYKSLFKNQELLDYSRQIFGEITGTEELIKSLS